MTSASSVRDSKLGELHVLLNHARVLLSDCISVHHAQPQVASLPPSVSASLHPLLIKLKHVITLVRTFENDCESRMFLDWAAKTLSYVIDTSALHRSVPPSVSLHLGQSCAAAVENGEVQHSPHMDDETKHPIARGDARDIEVDVESSCARRLNSTAGQFLIQSPLDILVSWGDIIGAKSAVTALKQAVVLPRKMPHLFSGPRKPWSCILLYGPPGTGKTLLASASAKEAGSDFISVSVSDLLSKWVGDTEKSIRNLFLTASKSNRCIIFLDEVDALCGARGAAGESEASRRAKTEFLVRMQNVDSRTVTIVAATNLPWELDTAFRRRFDRVIYVGLPDLQERATLLCHYLAGAQHSIHHDELYEVSRAHLEGFSPCDIAHVCQHAMMIPIERLQSATHFRCVKQVCARGRLSDGTGRGHNEPQSCWEPNVEGLVVDVLVPCDNDAEGAFCATLDDLDPSLIGSPAMTTEDLIAAARAHPLTVSKEYLRQYQDWETSLRAP